jgi:hypothetical protein
MGQLVDIDIARDKDGGIVPVPRDLTNGDGSLTPNFADTWNRLFDDGSANSENRESRFKSYDRMDASGAESALILDTYADETLNIVDSSRYSIKVEMSDENIKKKVNECFNINGIWERAREDIRSLSKYGDFAFTISLRGNSGSMVRVDEKTANGVKISDPLKPESININFLKSPSYELRSTQSQIYKLVLSNTAPKAVLAANNDREDGFNPWEFVLVSIGSRDTYPYGISMLEKVRLPWEQLTVLEQLLAVTRANKIDRVAITVPTGGGDITAVMRKLSMLKNFVKTVVLNMGNQRVSRNQDFGLTDYLWLPDSFKAQKLATSIDTGTIDDVNYFRDRFYNAARLPQGFFLDQRADLFSTTI